MLSLTRPLVAVDVETHAKVSPDEARIVELGFLIYYPDGREPLRRSGLLDPGCSISREVTEVHGITDADVRGRPTFASGAARLAPAFTNVDFCGYNVTFDLRVLKGEFRRAGITWSYDSAYLLDAYRLWQIAQPRSLTHAVEAFLDQKPREAHRAAGDAEDAYDVAIAMLERYHDLPRNLEQLHQLSFPPDRRLTRRDKEVCLNFGKHRGTPLSKVPRGYLEWILGSDFSDEVKNEVRKYL